VIVGAELRVIVTLKLQEFVLPTESVAAQVTVVIPTGRVLPGDGEQPKLPRLHESEALAE
ncbi:MAG TPA: hypothetical protein VEO53_09250, partial [Candidatus Binatia bacterium]|nr:hypothetical protein [Candidatus Binatia bacterium]